MTYSAGGYEIGIDVDDVLVQCHDRLCAVVSRVCGYELIPEMTPHKIEAAIGDDRAKQVWDIVDRTPGWNSAAPFQAALDALPRLRAIGPVVAVTSPHTTGTWMNDRVAWLNSIGFEKDDIIQTSGKFRVPVDALIDDLTSNLVKWKRRNPHGLAIRWASSHNKHETVPHGIFATDSWDAVIRAIGRHKRARAETQHVLYP